MRPAFKIPQWIPTALLVLLVPVIGCLAVSYISDTQTRATAAAQSDADMQLIAYLHQQYDAQFPRDNFQWRIQRRDGDSSLVCYCSRKGYGWWYEVKPLAGGQFTSTKVADTSAAALKP